MKKYTFAFEGVVLLADSFDEAKECYSPVGVQGRNPEKAQSSCGPFKEYGKTQRNRSPTTIRRWETIEKILKKKLCRRDENAVGVKARS